MLMYVYVSYLRLPPAGLLHAAIKVSVTKKHRSFNTANFELESPLAFLLLIIGTSGRRSSQSEFVRSTDKNVSGHYKRHYFFPFPPFFPFSLRPYWPFRGPLAAAAILDFAGGTAFQVVSPRRP